MFPPDQTLAGVVVAVMYVVRSTSRDSVIGDKKADFIEETVRFHGNVTTSQTDRRRADNTSDGPNPSTRNKRVERAPAIVSGSPTTARKGRPS